MSGIFGIFNRNEIPVEKKVVDTMLDAMSYWEPDERDVWVDGSVALGHAMLWNTPESKYEHFPLHRDAYVLTMDARIDNREELANEIELPNRPLSEIGDSEFILGAYHKWGDDCPKYLLGDFAFAIWDEKKQQMFCARDHIGIKPFYYYLDKNFFIFGNDIRVILKHLQVKVTFYKKAIAIFIQVGRFIDKRETFYSQIKKLPAASTLIINKKSMIENVYWNVENIKKIELSSLDGYVKKLRDLLNDSVSVRLRSVYPLSSHLTGGLDSSAITVLASRELHDSEKSLKTFNWVQPPTPEEDLDYCEWGFSYKIIEKENNLSHENIMLTPQFVADLIENTDITLNEDNLYWEEAKIRELAKSDGIRTILSGWGGDELISYGGHSYNSNLVRQGKIIKAFKNIFEHGQKNNDSLWRITKKTIRTIIYPFLSKYMSGIYKVEEDDYRFCFTKPEFEAYAKNIFPPILKFRKGPHGEQIELYEYGHILHRIEHWYTSGAKNKLEYRYPLLDKRIVEYALAIPDDLYKVNKGYARYLFRSAISDILPEDIVWAPKYVTPIDFKKRKKLWLSTLQVFLEGKKSFLEIENDYIDSKSLYIEIENIVNENSTDFQNINKIGAIEPALSIMYKLLYNNQKINVKSKVMRKEKDIKKIWVQPKVVTLKVNKTLSGNGKGDECLMSNKNQYITCS